MLVNGEAVLVDVRDLDAYEQSHIPGAVNIPAMFYELSMTTAEGLDEMVRIFTPLFSNAGLSKDKTVMLEAGAYEVAEDVAIEAITKAHAVNKEIIAGIEKLQKKAGIAKQKVAPDQNLHK